MKPNERVSQLKLLPLLWFHHDMNKKIGRKAFDSFKTSKTTLTSIIPKSTEISQSFINSIFLDFCCVISQKII